jgi:AraC-like DNA-binding protein
MSVSTVLVRVLVEAVERSGVPRTALLGAAGIDADRLAAASGRFELEDFAALQTAALDLTSDEALGLHMAEQATEGGFDLLAHLIMHAPTMRDAVGLLARFQGLLSDHAELTLREKGPVATFQYDFARSNERSDRMHAEFVMAALLRFIRLFGGPSAAARAVTFEHARPAHHREHARLFGGVERFQQSATAFAFDRDLLDRTQLHQSPELYAVLQVQAERSLERISAGQGPSARLQQYLLARPPSRIPDMATAARDLGTSVRSLRRRLAADATSYRLLVKARLEASAAQMLRDPHRTIQQTAQALGFSDAAAFHRAFRRWTGMTPKQYQER